MRQRAVRWPEVTKELPGSSFDSFSGGKARLSKAKQSEAQERDQSTGFKTSAETNQCHMCPLWLLSANPGFGTLELLLKLS